MSKAREERIKMVAGTANTVGLAFLGFALVRPLVEGDGVGWPAILFTMATVVLHLLAHYVLGRLDRRS